MGFYKLKKNNRFIKSSEHNLQETRLKAPYTKKDNLIQQETSLKKALELNPRNDEAYTRLGWLYLKQGKLSEAEQLFKKAIELNPQNDEACMGLGWVYIEQGKDTEAEEALKNALELNSHNDRAYTRLGWLYIRQGKDTEAEQVFKKAIELNPQTDWAYGSLAVLYGEMGNNILRKEYEDKAKQIRKRFYNPITINHYRTCKQILNKRQIGWICAQYPMRSIEPLKKIFKGEEGIIFVDNEETFKNAVLKDGYTEYFNDFFGGDFGHCTEKGNKLLAENIANAILKEVFGK